MIVWSVRTPAAEGRRIQDEAPKEVDLQTDKRVTSKIEDQRKVLKREHERLTSEAAMPELPDPSIGWTTCQRKIAERSRRCWWSGS
jgi:hypothetical protein